MSKRSQEIQEQQKANQIQQEIEFNEEFLTVRLDFIRQILGEEEALREESRARELASQGNFQAAAASISAAEVKARRADILSIQKFEALSQRERLSNLQSTLGQIASLQESGSKELFFIGKSAAIATATIDGLLAVQRALASAPPPLNFALAGVVGAATVANISKIASQKPTELSMVHWLIRVPYSVTLNLLCFLRVKLLPQEKTLMTLWKEQQDIEASLREAKPNNKTIQSP